MAKVIVRFMPYQHHLIKEAAAAAGLTPAQLGNKAMMAAALKLLPSGSTLADQMLPLLVPQGGWTQRSIVWLLYTAACDAAGHGPIAGTGELRKALKAAGIPTRRQWQGGITYFHCALTDEAQAMLDAYMDSGKQAPWAEATRRTNYSRKAKEPT